MIALYIILIAIGIAAIVFGIYARKKIAECKTEEEKKSVKAKWQRLSGLFGFVCMVIVAIFIFTMF